jgi:hypothetical protein
MFRPGNHYIAATHHKPVNNNAFGKAYKNIHCMVSWKIIYRYPLFLHHLKNTKSGFCHVLVCLLIRADAKFCNRIFFAKFLNAKFSIHNISIAAKITPTPIPHSTSLSQRSHVFYGQVCKNAKKCTSHRAQLRTVAFSV